MFEQATKMKLRFPSNMGGTITPEDLWDLSLSGTNKVSLNEIAKILSKNLKATDEEDFVGISNAKDDVTELKFEMVKHVISVKKEELAAEKNAASTKLKKERLLTLLARKQNEEEMEMSKDEIEALLSEL